MTWVFLSLRKMQLKQRLSNYQNRLIQISQKLMDMQELAAAVADGKITYMEGASAPSSLFGTQMNFLGQSSSIAYQSAQVKTNAYLQQMQTINQATGGQYQYSLDPTSMAGYIQDGQIQPYLIFNSIYQEELDAYANQYAQELNRQEQDLEQEKLTLETQIKAIQAEYEAVEQQEGDNIQSDAIKLS